MPETTKYTRFESEFLNEVDNSLAKRRKALKHKFHEVESEKTYEIEHGVENERFELRIRSSPSPKDLRCRLVAWPNRWVWVDARKSAKMGWEWVWTFEGRLLGTLTSRDLVIALELSLDLSKQSGRAIDMMSISKIWKSSLAVGPTKL